MECSKNAINSVLSVMFYWIMRLVSKTVDVRSNPTWFFVSLFILSSFFFLLIFWPFSSDIFSLNMWSYLQISPELNLNAYFHLFLCYLFLCFIFSSSWRSIMGTAPCATDSFKPPTYRRLAQEQGDCARNDFMKCRRTVKLQHNNNNCI